MAKGRSRASAEINSSSMADIAFLLLIFFLMTTTIASDKGIMLQLPPKPENIQNMDVKIPERNLFKILLNSNDRLLVEGEPMPSLTRLKPQIKEFVLNNGVNPDLSDSPEKAVISFKTDRGTSYEKYIEVLDEVQAAYNEMYADRVGITAERFRSLDLKNPREKSIYERARQDFPRNISFAEPTNIGGN
ncbi:MAG: ExbD/TolR family protein [Candidatus Cyclobacteriaceae bacterium M3_2C_046]